jgi:hypothetical protein
MEILPVLKWMGDDGRLAIKQVFESPRCVSSATRKLIRRDTSSVPAVCVASLRHGNKFVATMILH